MPPWLTRFWRDRRAELDEAVFVLPVLLLVCFGLVNLSLLGYASLTAANAANYGARLGSVALEDPLGTAGTAARSVVGAVGVGTYQVAVLGSPQPGSLIRVQVTYSVPNYFAPLTRLFGVTTPPAFQGTARADFRKEGW